MHASKYGRGVALLPVMNSTKHATAKHDEITDVESVAVYNEEKDEVTIFAVNRNLEEDVELTTDVRSFEGYRILEHIVMENEDLKAGNSLAGEKVYPVNGDERSKLDGGVLTSVIKKASWNVIRLGKLRIKEANEERIVVLMFEKDINAMIRFFIKCVKKRDSYDMYPLYWIHTTRLPRFF